MNAQSKKIIMVGLFTIWGNLSLCSYASIEAAERIGEEKKVRVRSVSSSPTSKEDLKKAETLYRKGCELKRFGRSYSEAFKLLKKAARLKYAPAQYELAIMLENGRGCKKDLKKAISWYKKAASKGHDLSLNALGALCEDKNLEKAIRYYTLSAKTGYSLAQENLDRIKEEQETGYIILREKY